MRGLVQTLGRSAAQENGSLMLSSRSVPAGSGFFWVARPRSLRLADLRVETLPPIRLVILDASPAAPGAACGTNPRWRVLL
jgi:hypothetical protein